MTLKYFIWVLHWYLSTSLEYFNDPCLKDKDGAGSQLKQLKFNVCGAVEVRCNLDAKRLYDDILRKNNYNKLIRPVGNNTDKLTVKLGLRLSQLIDVVSLTSLIAKVIALNINVTWQAF